MLHNSYLIPRKHNSHPEPSDSLLALTVLENWVLCKLYTKPGELSRLHSALGDLTLHLLKRPHKQLPHSKILPALHIDFSGKPGATH